MHTMSKFKGGEEAFFLKINKWQINENVNDLPQFFALSAIKAIEKAIKMTEEGPSN